MLGDGFSDRCCKKSLDDEYSLVFLQTYVAPQLLIVEKTNCYRIYGTVLLIVLGGIAVLGMRMVNKFALVFLVCVLISVGAVLTGMAVNSVGNQHLK